VKYLLLSLVFIIALVPFGLAQREPLALRQYEQSRDLSVGHSKSSKTFTPNTAPSYCKPCLAYGGDFDANDPLATALADGNTLVFGETEVWVPVVVKVGMTVSVTGIFGNFLTALDSTVDPVATPWAIRAHISDGDGGKLGFQGASNVTVTPTGRIGFGLNEYTILAKFDEPITLHGFSTGATYYFLIQPQCTNPENQTCSSGQRYYLSDSETSRPNHGGLPTPNDHAFFNAPYFGYVYQPAQNPCPFGCDNFSQGLLGTVQKHSSSERK